MPDATHAAGAVPPAPPAPTSKFKLEDGAYTLGPAIADAIADLNVTGLTRWGRFIRQLHESDAGDPDNEIPASQIILDALTYPFAANATACKRLLERGDVPLEEDARKDLAIQALLGMIDVYVTDVSMLARFEAAKDAFFTGKTKRTVKTAATVVGGGFVLLFIANVVLTALLFVAGAAVLVAGVVLYIQKELTYVPMLIASGGGVLLLGCASLAGVGWFVKAIEEPFVIAKATILAMIAAFKHSINPPHETAE